MKSLNLTIISCNFLEHKRVTTYVVTFEICSFIKEIDAAVVAFKISE